MCGRYASPDKEAVIMRWPKIRCGCGADWKPSANVAPTASVPVILRAQDGAWELQAARWGLVPPWWTSEKPPARTFNARAEEAARKPTWHDSLRARRCLMPARGWYEWNRREPALDAAGRESGLPYFLHRPAEPVFAFAGLWSPWPRPGAAPVLTCALLSRAAAPGLVRIHPRMPAVLNPEQFSRWLDPATPLDAVQELIAAAGGEFAAHPVSTRVNHVRHDDPALMDEIHPPPAGLFPADGP